MSQLSRFCASVLLVCLCGSPVTAATITGDALFLADPGGGVMERVLQCDGASALSAAGGSLSAGAVCPFSDLQAYPFGSGRVTGLGAPDLGAMFMLSSDIGPAPGALEDSPLEQAPVTETGMNILLLVGLMTVLKGRGPRYRRGEADTALAALPGLRGAHA